MNLVIMLFIVLCGGLALADMPPFPAYGELPLHRIGHEVVFEVATAVAIGSAAFRCLISRGWRRQDQIEAGERERLETCLREKVPELLSACRKCLVWNDGDRTKKPTSDEILKEVFVRHPDLSRALDGIPIEWVCEAVESELPVSSSCDDFVWCSEEERDEWFNRFVTPPRVCHPHAGWHPTLPGFDAVEVIGGGSLLKAVCGKTSVAGALPGETVVVKVLEVVDTTVCNRQLLDHQRELLGAIRHPHIVRSLGCFDSDTDFRRRRYVVREYLEGESLSQRLKRMWRQENRMGLELAEAIRMIDQVCAACEYLVAKGVNEQVILPDRIFICEGGVVKLTGLEQAYWAAGIRDGMELRDLLYARDEIDRLFRYAAPEVLLGKASVGNPSALVYSIGACLYLAVTGRCCVKEQTCSDRYLSIKAGAHSSIEDVKLRENPALARLLRDMLEPDPLCRIQGVAEVRQRMAALIPEAKRKEGGHMSENRTFCGQFFAIFGLARVLRKGFCDKTTHQEGVGDENN